jgi:hypothetical protein
MQYVGSAYYPIDGVFGCIFVEARDAICIFPSRVPRLALRLGVLKSADCVRSVTVHEGSWFECGQGCGDLLDDRCPVA